MLVRDAGVPPPGVPPGSWMPKPPPDAMVGLMASWVSVALLEGGGLEASKPGIVAKLGTSNDDGESAWMFWLEEKWVEVPGRVEK